MYAPPFFAVTDTTEMLAFAGKRAFGTVILPKIGIAYPTSLRTDAHSSDRQSSSFTAHPNCRP